MNKKIALAALSLLLVAAGPGNDAVFLSDVSNLPIRDAIKLLQQSENGQALSPYLVRCALGPDDQVPLADGEALNGQQALAPAWLERPLTAPEQRMVSACILSLMNYSGAHVQVMLTSAAADLPKGPVDTMRFQEGAFYGNLFLKDPLSFTCSGDPDTTKSVSRALRVCTEDGGNGESKCGMVLAGSCQAVCKQGADGAFESCKGRDETYREVVTVYLEQTGK